MSAMSSPNSYWYWRGLKKAWVLNFSTTNKLPLPERGHLSGIAIHSVCKNAVKLDKYSDAYPIQRHTKFRVIGNGNFEIVNASGKHLKSIECWNDNVDPKGMYDQGMSKNQRNFITIPFGRYMGDEDYGLILENFAAGAELEETNNYVTTHFTEDESKLDVYGLFRKRPEPTCMAKGFLRKRVIIEKDTQAEVEYAVRMPTLNKIRQIHLFSEADRDAHGLDKAPPIYCADYVFLTTKSKEELILNNVRNRELCYWQHNHFGRLFHTHVSSMGGTDGLSYVDSMIYRGHMTGGIPHMPAVGDHSVTTSGGDRRIKLVWWRTGATGALNVGGETDFEGIALHGHTPLLVIDPYAEEDDYLDADELKDVYVAITEGSAKYGTWWIVLDELQKFYPT